MTRAVRNTLLRALDLADCFGAGNGEVPVYALTIAGRAAAQEAYR